MTKLIPSNKDIHKHEFYNRRRIATRRCRSGLWSRQPGDNDAWRCRSRRSARVLVPTPRQAASWDSFALTKKTQKTTTTWLFAAGIVVRQEEQRVFHERAVKLFFFFFNNKYFIHFNGPKHGGKLKEGGSDKIIAARVCSECLWFTSECSFTCILFYTLLKKHLNSKSVV